MAATRYQLGEVGVHVGGVVVWSIDFVIIFPGVFGMVGYIQ